MGRTGTAVVVVATAGVAGPAGGDDAAGRAFITV
jgi:hypothetical protein